jgi:UDP-N-acetylmuramoylalanine--D-glutamate ligase
MRNSEYFKGKRVAVVGLARSGLACANLLHRLGAKVSVTDSQDNPLLRQNVSKLESRDIKFELGGHSEDFVKDRDMIVLSPGVTDNSLPVVLARELGIPVIAEVEVGWILCPGTIIAVTGTNGKTTVTTLIAKSLQAQGRRVFVCGNIGNPFCNEVDKMDKDTFVSLEVSSFQLERIREFKPKIAVMLNFSSNHLDRYKDVKQYLQAKKRIYMNQDENDHLVLNQDDQTLKALAAEARSKVTFFSETQDLNPNQAAVMAVSGILGIAGQACRDVFRNFKGIEHRLEFVAEIDGIKFINDSKATTVDAAVWALRNILAPSILICGGRDKGNDYSVISGLMQDKVKEVFLIGEAQSKMSAAFRGLVSLQEVNSLEEAVRLAFNKASRGYTVLLSPMCSSFDMFTDYEDRGRKFKKAVQALKQKH